MVANACASVWCDQRTPSSAWARRCGGWTPNSDQEHAGVDVAAQPVTELGHVEVQLAVPLDLVVGATEVDGRVRHLLADQLDRGLGFRAQHQADPDPPDPGLAVGRRGLARLNTPDEPEAGQQVQLVGQDPGQAAADRLAGVAGPGAEQRGQRPGGPDALRRPRVEPAGEHRAVGVAVGRVGEDEPDQFGGGVGVPGGVGPRRRQHERGHRVPVPRGVAGQQLGLHQAAHDGLEHQADRNHDLEPVPAGDDPFGVLADGHQHRVGHPGVPGPGVGEALPGVGQVEHQVHDVLQMPHAVADLERDRERNRVAESLPHRVAQREEQPVLHEGPGRVVAGQHRVPPAGVDAAAEAGGQLGGDEARQGLFGMVGGGDVGPLPQPGGITVVVPVTAPDGRRGRRVRLPALVEADRPADVQPLIGADCRPTVYSSSSIAARRRGVNQVKVR
jgi:hypothetical protein